MNTQHTKLREIAETLPQVYLDELLDFARFLHERAERTSKSDTEYLDSIPGMVDSIVESRRTGLQDCSQKLDW